MTVKISVITAIYNIPQRILREALDCFQRQTLKSSEFLLINDASPDDYTAQVLAEYAAGDSRFKVITHTENKGIGATVNDGLNAAAGEYVCRIDPDDLVPDNYLEVMCQVMDFYSADMVTCAIKWFKDGDKINFQNSIDIKRYLSLHRPLGKRKMSRQKFICRVFKKSVIGDLRFEERLHRGEDLLFIHRYLLKCEKTVEIDFPGYFYRRGRIFSEGEQRVLPSVFHAMAPDFYAQTRLESDVWAKMLADCKDRADRSFISYMLIRRFMRSAFGFRKMSYDYYPELYKKIHINYSEKVQSAVENMHPFFAKYMTKIFCEPSMPSNFFIKIQILRLFFELKHLSYYFCRIIYKSSLKIHHVRG